MQAAELLQHALIAEEVPAKWLALGDANETPQNSEIASTLDSFQGAVLEQGCPARWNGLAELDWAHTSQPSLIRNLRFGDLHYSDHKGVEFEVPIAPKA